MSLQMPWQQKREVARRMTTSKTFEDYPGSESGGVNEEAPANYGGRKPFPPIKEEEEEHVEEVMKKQRSGLPGGVASSHKAMATSRSSTSPKHQSLSPSSSDHSSPRSPPTHPPPPPTSQPPPLPSTQLRGSSQGAGFKPQVPKSGMGLPQRPTDRKQYDMYNYGNHQSEDSFSGRGLINKPHPQHPHSNQEERSHSEKNSVSGSKTTAANQVMEVKVNSNIIPSEQYPTAITDQSTLEGVATGPPQAKLDHMDPGIRESPSGASSPSSTPNNTLNKPSRGGHAHHYDPLSASASETKLTMRLAGGVGRKFQPPQDGGGLETISDSNLLKYSSYANEGSRGGGGGVVNLRGHVTQGGTHFVKSGQQSSRTQENLVGGGGGGGGGRGVSGPIKDWERRHNSDVSGGGGGGGGGEDGGGEAVRSTSSTIPKERDHSPSTANIPLGGRRNPGTVSSVSPDHPGGVVRPPSSDSGYVPSSSSAHSLSPSHTNHNPTADMDPDDQHPHPHPHQHDGDLDSPSSSTEELMQINLDPSKQEEEGEQDSIPNHAIIKPEPTKSTSYQQTQGMYGNKQATPQAPPIGYHPPSATGDHAPPTYHHPVSLSQPGPSPQHAPHGLNAPSSLSQGPSYYHHPPSTRGAGPDMSAPPGGTYGVKTRSGVEGNAPPPSGGAYKGSTRADPGTNYGGSGPRGGDKSVGGYGGSGLRGDMPGGAPGANYSGSGYNRQKLSYENVPMVYETLQHVPHPHQSQNTTSPKYGGVAQQNQHQQPGFRGDPRERSHDPRDLLPTHTGAPDYSVMHPSSYPPGAGSRRKPIAPGSIAVAHDAAGSGDIATLHHMLTNHEIDAFTFNEHRFTLAHKAALNGQLGLLNFLVNDAGLPLTALNIPDDSYSTPAMLAIQGGHVECLQWMVEEYKVPLEVRDTGGETLMHHAAYNGQVKCLEWLLKAVQKKEDQHKEILDDSGVTPSHFAAQGGHLDCLQLLIDHGYSVVHADQDNQKPLDWADAMNQTVCVRYLMMYEACWALSAEVTHLSEQLVMLRKDYNKVLETLTLQNQEHQHAMALLQQSHEERMAKLREQYVDFTASLLKNTGSSSATTTTSATSAGGGGVGKSPTSSSGGGAGKNPSSGSGGGGAGKGTSSGGVTGGDISSSNNAAFTKAKSVRKAPTDPPHNQRRPGKPPVPPDAVKKHQVRGGQSHESKAEDLPDLEYRTETPQEVMKKQLSTVAKRMTLSREARKRQSLGRGAGLVPRNCSPLTPIMQRLYSKADEEQGRGERERVTRSQRHGESHDRRGAPKMVKFSNTVTEFPEYSRFDEENRAGKISGGHKHSPVHSSTGLHPSPGHSPGHGYMSNVVGGGQFNDRSVPDGEPGQSKTDGNNISRKSSAEK